MKIGIFGGSFNPPHKMHKNIAKSLIKKGYIDKAIVVPTADNYEKAFLLNGLDRYNMLKQMFKDDKNIIVSPYEIEGRLYTINTLNYFHEKYPKAELYFICGTDNLAYLDKWFKYEEILSKYHLLVIARDTNDFYKEISKYEKYKNRIILANIKPKVISSTNIRNIIVKKGYCQKLKEYLYVDTIKYLKTIDAKDYWKNSI